MTSIAPGVRILADRLALDGLRNRRRAGLSQFSAQDAGRTPDDAYESRSLARELEIAADVTGGESAGVLRLSFEREAVWLREQRAREMRDTCADLIRTARRWSVSIDPGDGRTRFFVMNGTHSEVLTRARALFSKPSALVLTPLAGVGRESVDSGLNVILKPKS